MSDKPVFSLLFFSWDCLDCHLQDLEPLQHPAPDAVVVDDALPGEALSENGPDPDVPVDADEAQQVS